MGEKPALRGNKHDRMFGSALYEHDMTNAPDVTAAKRYYTYLHLFVVMVVCWYDEKEQS